MKMYITDSSRRRLRKIVSCFLTLQMILTFVAVPSVFAEDTQTLPLPEPVLEIFLDTDLIIGYGWMVNSTVNISVYSDEIDFQKYYATTDSDGSFEKDFSALNVNLQGGQKLIVSDGTTNKELIISSIRVTAIDIENDLIYGSIEPNADVQTIIMIGFEPSFREPVPDADGLWVADYSVPWTDIRGNINPTFDIVSDTEGAVRNHDGHTIATLSSWTASTYAVILGDLNNDSKVDTNDVPIILKYLAGKLKLTELQLIAADCDRDGNIDMNDVKLILKQLAKDYRR